MKSIFVALTLLGACFASPTTYVVKPGDDYYKISQKYGYDIREIEALNPQVDPRNLWVGDKILVPGGNGNTPTIPTSNSAGSADNVYIIQEGDNLWNICEREGYNFNQVVTMNRNIDVRQLQPGQEIIVPGKGGRSMPVKGGDRSSSPSSSSSSPMKTGDDLSCLPKEFTQPLYPVLGIYGLKATVGQQSATPLAATVSLDSSLKTPMQQQQQQSTAFLGQTRYPDIHASLYDIWMTRSERDKPMFRLVNLNTQPLVQQSGLLVPPRKYFTRSKDWVPTTNWIVRHTKVIPSIVVCFYDLPDGDNMQDQRDMLIMNDINEKRKQLVTRNIRLVIIFLTDNYQLNKIGIDERLARFKLVCSLESKNSMYVLPSSGLDLVEFISGIESNLQEPANQYYLHEAKRWKKKQQKLNRNTQAELFTRYEFKSAFFNEFRRDIENCQKSFYYAYTAATGYFIAECGKNKDYLSSKIGQDLRTLIDSTAIKIGLLYFPTNPGDAYAIFSRHVQIMKSTFGPDSDHFAGSSHSSWLAKMHGAIGDAILFAGKTGASIVHDPMKILQAQHPGFHFLISANNAIAYRDSFKIHKRKSRFESINNATASASVGDLDELAEGLDKSLSFSNVFDLQQPTGQVDQAKVLSDVSNFIVDQLTKSYECFKKSKTASRSNVYIASLIAHEYGQAKKFDLALKFYDRILRGYRNGRDRDGWWSVVISGLLERVIQCAIHLGMHERILEASFEMIGLASAKQVWMDTFLRSLKNLGNFGAATFSSVSEDLLCVGGEGDGKNGYYGKGSAGTGTISSPTIPPLVVDMTSMGIETLYNVSGAFSLEETTVNSIVPFQLVIYSKAPEPFYPTLIEIEFSNSDCNRTLQSLSVPTTLEDIKSHGRTASSSNLKAPFITRYLHEEEDTNFQQPQHSLQGASSLQNISKALDSSKLLVIYPGGPNVIEFPVFVGSHSGLLVATGVSFVFGAFGVSGNSMIGRSFHFNHRFPVTAEDELSMNRNVGDIFWFQRNEIYKNDQEITSTNPSTTNCATTNGVTTISATTIGGATTIGANRIRINRSLVNSIQVNPKTLMLDVSLTCSSVASLDEYIPVTVRLSPKKGTSPKKSGKTLHLVIDVTCKGGNGQSELTSSFSQIRFGTMDTNSGTDIERVVYVQVTDRNMIECPLVFKFWDSNHVKSVSESITIKICKSPFELCHNWKRCLPTLSNDPQHPTMMTSMSNLSAYEGMTQDEIFMKEEKFILLGNVKNLYTEDPGIKVHSVRLVVQKGELEEKRFPIAGFPVVIPSGNVYSFFQQIDTDCMNIDVSSSNTSDQYKLVFEWSRNNGGGDALLKNESSLNALLKNESSFKISAVPKQRPIEISSFLPFGSVGYSGKPFVWVICLSHRGIGTRDVFSICAMLEGVAGGGGGGNSGSGILVSGHRQQTFRLAPFTTFKMIFNMVCLGTGLIALPRIKFTVTSPNPNLNLGSLVNIQQQQQQQQQGGSALSLADKINENDYKHENSKDATSDIQQAIYYYPSSEDDQSNINVKVIFIKPTLESFK